MCVKRWTSVNVIWGNTRLKERINRIGWKHKKANRWSSPVPAWNRANEVLGLQEVSGCAIWVQANKIYTLVIELSNEGFYFLYEQFSTQTEVQINYELTSLSRSKWSNTGSTKKTVVIHYRVVPFLSARYYCQRILFYFICFQEGDWKKQLHC